MPIKKGILKSEIVQIEAILRLAENFKQDNIAFDNNRCKYRRPLSKQETALKKAKIEEGAILSTDLIRQLGYLLKGERGKKVNVYKYLNALENKRIIGIKHWNGKIFIEGKGNHGSICYLKSSYEAFIGCFRLLFKSDGTSEIDKIILRFLNSPYFKKRIHFYPPCEPPYFNTKKGLEYIKTRVISSPNADSDEFLPIVRIEYLQQHAINTYKEAPTFFKYIMRNKNKKNNALRWAFDQCEISQVTESIFMKTALQFKDMLDFEDKLILNEQENAITKAFAENLKQLKKSINRRKQG